MRKTYGKAPDGAGAAQAVNGAQGQLIRIVTCEAFAAIGIIGSQLGTIAVDLRIPTDSTGGRPGKAVIAQPRSEFLLPPHRQACDTGVPSGVRTPSAPTPTRSAP
ncbi:hypothetical protein GCM10009540_31540 [Streptomyces turgidiscabies]